MTTMTVADKVCQYQRLGAAYSLAARITVNTPGGLDEALSLQAKASRWYATARLLMRLEP
jgi:hypothetical protein